jgi:hypothetical protein
LALKQQRQQQQQQQQQSVPELKQGLKRGSLTALTHRLRTALEHVGP